MAPTKFACEFIGVLGLGIFFVEIEPPGPTVLFRLLSIQAVRVPKHLSADSKVRLSSLTSNPDFHKTLRRGGYDRSGLQNDVRVSRRPALLRTEEPLVPGRAAGRR